MMPIINRKKFQMSISLFSFKFLFHFEPNPRLASVYIIINRLTINLKPGSFSIFIIDLDFVNKEVFSQSNTLNFWHTYTHERPGAQKGEHDNLYRWNRLFEHGGTISFYIIVNTNVVWIFTQSGHEGFRSI